MNTLVSECNGLDFRERKLVVQFNNSDKSKLPYGKRDLQRGEIKGRSVQTSGYKMNLGDLRPASSASSRPKESTPCANREQGEFGDVNPEVVGGGVSTLKRNERTMAQNLRDRQNRHRLEERKKCQLLIEVPDYHSSMTPPDAGVVCRAH